MTPQDDDALVIPAPDLPAGRQTQLPATGSGTVNTLSGYTDIAAGALGALASSIDDQVDSDGNAIAPTPNEELLQAAAQTVQTALNQWVTAYKAAGC
jgi:hypothetical protein